MSNETVISVENLSKRYRIGAREEGYKTFRETLVDIALAPVRRLRNIARLSRFSDSAEAPVAGDPADTIWALKDVSFEVERGEVVGIIGRNGAGKSTLLKVLSRITEPTSGRVRIKGRVASLLEVGTGFHPELTGRENIFLNGAILGMTKADIRRKFDEIVAFAEIEKFIDTPVKRYSSGMYVRLAFAVAAHLEPEILLVDEVLAVGDAAFQKKCLGKMGDVAREGRTVLLVSHNMPTIQALCARVILLEHGACIKDGDPAPVTSYYLSQSIAAGTGEASLLNHPQRIKSQDPALRRVWFTDEHGAITSSIFMGAPLTIHCEFICKRAILKPGFGFGIDDEHGRRIFTLNTHFIDSPKATLPRIRAGVAVCHIPEVILTPGRYFVGLALIEDEREIYDRVERAIVLDVPPVDVFGTGKVPGSMQGVVYVKGEIAFYPSDPAPAGSPPMAETRSSLE